MPNQRVRGACLTRHGRRTLAGKRPFRLGPDVLHPGANLWPIAQRCRYRLDRHSRRTEDYRPPAVLLIELQELRDEFPRRARAVMHLPVCDEYRSLHLCAVVEGLDAGERLALEKLE